MTFKASAKNVEFRALHKPKAIENGLSWVWLGKSYFDVCLFWYCIWLCFIYHIDRIFQRRFFDIYCSLNVYILSWSVILFFLARASLLYLLPSKPQPLSFFPLNSVQTFNAAHHFLLRYWLFDLLLKSQRKSNWSIFKHFNHHSSSFLYSQMFEHEHRAYSVKHSHTFLCQYLFNQIAHYSAYPIFNGNVTMKLLNVMLWCFFSFPFSPFFFLILPPPKCRTIDEIHRCIHSGKIDWKTQNEWMN